MHLLLVARNPEAQLCGCPTEAGFGLSYLWRCGCGKLGSTFISNNKKFHAGHPGFCLCISANKHRVKGQNTMSQGAGIYPSRPSRRVCSSRFAGVRRWGALLGGSSLAVLGLTRRSKTGVALAAAGGALALLGLRVDARPRKFTSRGSVVVNCSPEEAYRFWRDFENLPRFMRHLESVVVSDDRTSTWVAIGPLGRRVRWRAEITSERPRQSISWRSLPGSDLSTSGSVEFQAATGNRGTLIRASLRFHPPAGIVGKKLATMLGKSPDFLIQQDLRRLKALLETGEIPTTQGQPHGPRDVMTAVARIVDPDAVRTPSSFRDALRAQRRAS